MKTQVLFRLVGISVLSILLVVILFLLSEHDVHRDNSFVRRYPHHPIIKKYDLLLTFNSYYIAGHEDNILYLGNTTAPLHLIKVNLKTRDTQHLSIGLDTKGLLFRSINVKVHPPYFFLMDGFAPWIYRGNIRDWQAKVWMKDIAYFNEAIPLDSNRIYIRTTSNKTQETELGLIEKKSDGNINVILKPEILEKQIDGIFDVDGLAAVSGDYKILLYIYYYRNQFMIMDTNMNLLKREYTIDTIKTAQIKITATENTKFKKMKAPPRMVNRMAALYKDLVLVNSTRLGKYEDRDMLKEASIIDVYNWQNQSYEFSFYLYKIKNEETREFSIINDYLVAMIDDKLSVYQIGKEQFNKTPKFEIE